jgi:hypothetical protein
LLNLNGYHPEAFALMRRVHECVVKAVACKLRPTNTWKIGFSKSVQKAEHVIEIDLKRMWALESSFTHANSLKLFKAGQDMNKTGEDVGVTYGPQLDFKQFSAVANTSIFWIYFLVKTMPHIFEGSLNEYWFSKQDPSAELLKDFLTKSKSLSDEIQQIDRLSTRLRQK